MTNSPKSPYSKLLLSILFFLGCVALLVCLVILFRDRPYWSHSKIESRLNTSFPDDAYDIVINGSAYFLDLSFKTTVSSNFVENLCGGVIHQGYDPFNAMETALPTDDSILIHVIRQAFYSHSINTSMTIGGNRCYQQGILAFRVNRENGIDEVELSLRFDAEMNGILADYVNPNFDHNLPLLIVGLIEENGVYRQVYPEICMRISHGYYNGNIGLEYFVDDVEFFLGSEVEILIDEQPQLPVSIDAEFLSLQDNDNHRNVWHCIPTNLSAGIHTLTLNITRPIGDVYSHSWGFIAE